MNQAPQHDVLRSGAELIVAGARTWVTPRDVDAGTVILISGCTAHGHGMTALGHLLEGHGLRPLYFRYDPAEGIEAAAQALITRLRPLGAGLADHGYALLGHGLGGLVARRMAQVLPDDTPLKPTLRGIATLGTPHGGAHGRRWLAYFFDGAEAQAPVHPVIRRPDGPLMRQLLHQDDERLIEKINEIDRAKAPRVPLLSISGGLRHLELGHSAGRIRNRALQALLGDRPNDGLILEEQADLRGFVAADAEIRHLNTYTDYAYTNHDYLPRNQEIAGLLVEWLQNEAGLQSNIGLKKSP